MTTQSANHTPENSTERPSHPRWVVGVDSADCSRHAALWAAAQAPDRAGELQLATSWSVPVPMSVTPMSSVTTAAIFDDLEKAAESTVDELTQVVGATVDVSVTSHVGHGGAAGLLLNAAEQAELLVVGTRGQGGFSRLLLGSTSTQCATHCSVPVAVVPESAQCEPVSSIVVAFDGSENSIEALRWAMDFAAPGSTIECVSVWDTTPIAIGTDQFFFPEASDLAEERFNHLCARTIEPIQRPDIDVNTAFVLGQPRTVLAEVASEHDLLVMGARGHGAIGAALLGSVSTWLLHHSDTPAIVVPHRE